MSATGLRTSQNDPVIGRFLSNDPVGFATGGVDYFNRYSYTANDPINATDPDGRDHCGGKPFPSACEHRHNIEDPDPRATATKDAVVGAQGKRGDSIIAAMVVAVGLLDGPEPGPIDVAVVTATSKFKQVLMGEASAIAIDAALASRKCRCANAA